jgi:hypothetical protein
MTTPVEPLTFNVENIAGITDKRNSATTSYDFTFNLKNTH